MSIARHSRSKQGATGTKRVLTKRNATKPAPRDDATRTARVPTRAPVGRMSARAPDDAYNPTALVVQTSAPAHRFGLRDAKLKLFITTADGAKFECAGPFPDAVTFAIYMLACDWGDGASHTSLDGSVPFDFEPEAQRFIRAAEKHRLLVTSSRSPSSTIEPASPSSSRRRRVRTRDTR